MEQHHLLLDADRVRARPRGAASTRPSGAARSCRPPRVAGARIAARRAHEAGEQRALSIARRRGTRRATARRPRTAGPGASTPSTTPSGERARHPQAVPQAVDRLVVEGVHLACSSSPISPASAVPRSICTEWVVRSRGLGLAVSQIRTVRVRQVLDERSAARDVQRLRPAADREQRQPELPRAPRGGQLEAVDVRLRRAELPDAAARRSASGPRSGPPDRQMPDELIEQRRDRSPRRAPGAPPAARPPPRSRARTRRPAPAPSGPARPAACASTASLRRISEVVTPISGRRRGLRSRRAPTCPCRRRSGWSSRPARPRRARRA